MKIIMLLLMMLFSLNIFSCEFVEINGLTNQQIEELEKICKEKKSKNNTNQKIKEYTEYGIFAKEIAESITIVAKGLGVAIDEFIDTDAGKITLVLIIWELAGEKIIAIVFAVIFIIMLSRLLKLFLNIILTDKFEEKTRKTIFGNIKKYNARIYKTSSQISEDCYGAAAGSIIIFIVISGVLLSLLF